jgi:hypothetical protein
MTTNPPHPLDAWLFQPDGHLTEAALAAVADGEIELAAKEGPLLHLERCERCSQLLGQAALLSMAAGALVAEAGAPAVAPRVVPAPSKARRPVPFVAIAAAMAVAILTAGPSFAHAVHEVHAGVTEGVAMAPFLGRMALAIARVPWAEGPAGLTVKLGSALVFLMIGLRLARGQWRGPRQGSLQEGGV